MTVLATPLANVVAFVAAVLQGLAADPVVGGSVAAIALGVAVGATGLVMGFNDWRADRRQLD